MKKIRGLFMFSVLVKAMLISNNLLASDSFGRKIYTLDAEDPDVRRKFNAHIIPAGDGSFFVCWEQGIEEINNNTIICRLYNKDFSSFKPIDFQKPNPELRCFPVDLIEIKDSIYLYFMEMNTDVYVGTGISCLKRARLDTLNDSLIVQNYSIWETTQGSGMEFLTVGDQLMMPIYESKRLKDGLYHSIIGTIMLNQEGTKIIDTSYVNNEYNLQLVEPCVVKGQNDSLLMIIRAQEKGFIHYSYSTDQGKNWSPIQESSINSPESLSKVIYHSGYYFIIHNNIALDSTKARNSLDITVVNNAQLKNPKTFNLIYHEKDFYSNFSILVDDLKVYIPYQRLMFSSEYRYQPDRIEMITFDLNKVLEQISPYTE